MLSRVIAKCALSSRLLLYVKSSVRHHQRLEISTVFHKTHIRKFHEEENEAEHEQSPSEFNQFDQLMHKYLPFVENGDPVMTKIIGCNKIEDFLKLSEEVSGKEEIVQLLLRYGVLRNRNEPTIMKNMKEFLMKIDSCTDQMNAIELSFCLLHLRLLSIDLMKTKVTQEIIEKVYNHIKEKGTEVNSMALVLFTETLMLERSLYSKLIMVDTLPIIFEKLDKCDNAIDCYLLACCLNSVHPVLSMEALKRTRKNIEKFLDQGIVNEDHPKVIFKFLNYLNFPYWSSYNCQLIHRLLMVLEKSIPKMSQKELFQTNRALYAQYEPGKLIPLLRDRANELLNETKDVELLQIVCSYCTPDERTKYVEMLRDKVLTHQTTLGPGSDSLAVFFKILRLLKISDTELCDCFWTKIVNKIFSLKEGDLKYRIPKYFYRYMSFNNNLGGTYRHIEFEKIVTEYCLMEMRTTSSYIPKEFVKFASFVIAYGDQYDSIPNFIIDKLIMQQEQFDIFDCKQLARSIEILNGFRFKKGNPSKVLEDQIEILQFVLDNCARRHIQDPEIHLKQVNTILSSFVRRRGIRDSQLFYDIMKWYEKPNLELNSRAIREICHSIQTSKFCHDSVCDQFFEYIVANSELVTGETVEKVLTTCYNLSYFPEDPEALECCSKIIKRDFTIMNGLSIVQTLVALTFYKAVPFDLVSSVFQGDFIKKLEQEIQMAYRLEIYPQRVMSLVMQLNRAICLDFPEYNIRWFQQNFIEAQMSKKPVIRSKFQEDMRQLLLKIVPNREYLAVNRVTPYGYRIDFEIHLDNYNKFLKPIPEYYQDASFKPQTNKIAILLLGFDTFCINDVNRLKGEELLRMRHLEMMNYKVVHVKKSDFSMLYENINAKIKHMKSLLQVTA